MLKLTKSNKNFAAKHGLNIDIDMDAGNVLIFVGSEDENLLEYRFDQKGSLYFCFQVYGNKIEDLPAHITTTRQFNQVIKYVGSVLIDIE